MFKRTEMKFAACRVQGIYHSVDDSFRFHLLLAEDWWQVLYERKKNCADPRYVHSISTHLLISIWLRLCVHSCFSLQQHKFKQLLSSALCFFPRLCCSFVLANITVCRATEWTSSANYASQNNHTENKMQLKDGGGTFIPDPVQRQYGCRAVLQAG